MSSHPTFGNGKICYIDLPSIDINSSAAFYEKIFDWNIRRRDDGTISFDDRVGEVSGMWVLGREPATHIGFVISIMVFDILATIDLIANNGGKIIEVNLEGREKLARFSDPAGNIWGLYEHNA